MSRRLKVWSVRLGTSQAVRFHDPPGGICHGELEHGLCNVDGNGSSIHLGLLSFEDMIPTPMKTTADALVALPDPKFHLSNWTDQEIGFAMGRGLPVFAVRFGQDPYGLIGRFHAFAGAALRQRLAQLEQLASALRDSGRSNIAPPTSRTSVFIGHGRSAVWRELKDFLAEELALPWDEFNRESVAGIATTERLVEMLNTASFAFLVMTGEDEHADATLHARANVIHEVGLFQGRLGLRKAIVLLENGCAEFSNIHGLTHIPFPRGSVSSAFEEIRRVLRREQVIRI